MKKVILITGTRRNTREGHVWDYLDEHKPDIVIVGDATGADEEARRWCKFKGVHRFRCDALWRKRGKDAGPDRNEAMAWVAAAIMRGSPTSADVWCAAFPDSESRGTWDCVERAELYGVRVDRR